MLVGGIVQCVLAQEQMQRRLGRIERLQDGGGGARGIALFPAGILGEAATGEMGGFVVVGDVHRGDPETCRGKPGAKSSRRDVGDANIHRRDLLRQCLADAFQRILACSVDCCPGPGSVTADRGDVDDVSGTARAHRGEDRVDHPQHREDVDLEQRLCFLD